MLSISKTESRIVEFLLRRFSESYTIRSLANALKVSPAGAHKGVKKLEADGILYTERIGAALVCRLNLQNPVTEHLCSLLLVPQKKPEFDESLKDNAEAAIQYKDTTYRIGSESDPSSSSFSEADFLIGLLKKDADIIKAVRDGTVLFGESTIVRIIKNRGMP